MQDTNLLNKISNSLNQICEENKIKRIDQFTIVVNHQSNINEDTLRDHLVLNNRNVLGVELQIEIQRDDIDYQTAIIHSLQGETFEI